jgi:hypothetical protein
MRFEVLGVWCWCVCGPFACRASDREEQWSVRVRELEAAAARTLADVQAQAEARIAAIRADAAATAEAVDKLHTRQLETLQADHRCAGGGLLPSPTPLESNAPSFFLVVAHWGMRQTEVNCTVWFG